MMTFFFVLAFLFAVFVLWHAEVFAVLAAIWLFATSLTPLVYIKTHPVQAVLWVSSYFLIGAVWSIVKWWFAETERYRAVKELYNKKYMTDTPWETYVASMKTNPVNYKTDISIWIAVWPFSMVRTLANDPVRRAACRIRLELQAVYQRITDRVWL